ncbi:MAG: hypothetical protein IPP40_16345 [bacterium]|nr:hypothetical protein [bacterium]
MKKVLFGITLLCTLSLAFGETTTTTQALQSNQGATNGNNATGLFLDSPTSSRATNASSIMSKTEADTLRAHEGRLLATSDMNGIKVGNVGNDDLIYILVVVLLVVLIIAVI